LKVEKELLSVLRKLKEREKELTELRHKIARHRKLLQDADSPREYEKLLEQRNRLVERAEKVSAEIEELRKEYQELLFKENELLLKEEEAEKELRLLKRDYKYYLRELSRILDSLQSFICRSQESLSL
jgi:predicted  nucleic acid-binding Zn-ribbon protein